MVKKLLVAVSLASAIGLFSAAKEIVQVGLSEPAHNCVEHADWDDPAVLAHHKDALGK